MNLTITTKKDLSNSRNAVKLVHLLTAFNSSIYINKSGRRVNAKSILGLLSASILKGDVIEFNILNDNEFVEIKKTILNFLEEDN